MCVSVCENIADKGKRKNENKPKAIFNKFFFQKETVWLVFIGTVCGEEGGCQVFIDSVGWGSGVLRQCGKGYCHFLRKEDGSKLGVPRL